MLWTPSVGVRPSPGAESGRTQLSAGPRRSVILGLMLAAVVQGVARATLACWDVLVDNLESCVA